MSLLISGVKFFSKRSLGNKSEHQESTASEKFLLVLNIGMGEIKFV
jgi:hypothetical protein